MNKSVPKDLKQICSSAAVNLFDTIIIQLNPSLMLVAWLPPSSFKYTTSNYPNSDSN